jgi:hypothetical protein
MCVERSATIDQPVDRVFEYVSTPENDLTWVPASLRHEMLSPAPMRVGSITEEDVWFLGRRMRYAWEITQYEPPTAFALRSISGSIPATIRVLLESLDAWSLQADGACDDVGGPTAVRDPAAHTKESAGERRTTTLAPPRPPAPPQRGGETKRRQARSGVLHLER